MTLTPTREDVLVPPVDRVERPGFFWRHTSYEWPGGDEEFWTRQGDNNGWHEPESPLGAKHRVVGAAHSYHHFVHPDDYFDEHPEYFSEIGGVRVRDETQLCLTNPGQGYLPDEIVAEGEALFDEAAALVEGDEELSDRIEVARLPLIYARLFPRNGYEIIGDTLEFLGEIAPVSDVQDLLQTMADHGFGAWMEFAGSPDNLALIYSMFAMDHDLEIIDNDHLRVEVVPNLGGRALRIIHKATGESITAYNRIRNLYFPFCGGLEDRTGELFRFYGWVEPAAISDHDALSITTTQSTMDGMTIRRTLTLAVDAPVLHVESALVNPKCNEETLKAFEDFGLDGEDCDGVKQVGKADWFSFGGCDWGQHECGMIFCCEDYHMTWFPQETDWDIVGVVEALHGAIPFDERMLLDAAGRDDLLEGVSVVYEQPVVEYAGQPARDMAVEVSLGLIEVPFDTFQVWLPADRWGVELDHYLGGEVTIYETDAQERPIRQLERMVLSPFPCDWDFPLTNMDMTKVEVIEYSDGKAVVHWRVMYSDNDSTETDVGSVTFERYDDFSTLVTYHSAHRLNAPGGIHIPNDIVQYVLKTFFLGHIFHYGDVVESYL